jgi:xanthine dehydrogenase accessory factor
VREIVEDVERWRRSGSRVALARVVDLEGSGPRDPGAAMAVNEQGEVVGSVSGGCVEGAVVTEALEVLGHGRPRLVAFGYSDDEAFAVGLTCGGTIHLFIEGLDPAAGDDGLWDAWSEALRLGRPVCALTVIRGPHVGATRLVRPEGEPIGTLGDPDLDRVASREGLAALAAGHTSVRHFGAHGEANEAAVEIFVEAFTPPPRMVIFGAVDFTAALARAAKLLGYRVTVCDAREVFATRARFPMADELVVDWPDRLLARLGPDLGPADAVCVLTHDAKFDVPAIKGALATGVGYIGVMGSRRTHERRLQRLAEEGITAPADLDRLLAPIGIDIGARSPEETAVAICAEIIARRTDRPVPHLRDAAGPIHPDGR